MKRFMIVTSCLSSMLIIGSSCKQPGEPAADIASAVSAARKAVACRVDNINDPRLNRAQLQVLLYTISGKDSVSDADACTLVKSVEDGANGGAAASPADDSESVMAAFAQITFDLAGSIKEKPSYLKGVQTAGTGYDCTPLTHVFDQVTMALNKCGSVPNPSPTPTPSPSPSPSPTPTPSPSPSPSPTPSPSPSPSPSPTPSPSPSPSPSPTPTPSPSPSPSPTPSPSPSPSPSPTPSPSPSPSPSGPPAIKYADIYSRVFKPNACTGCHSDFKTYDKLMASGVVVAGNPGDSSLYQMVQSKAMPPDSDGISDDLIQLVNDWITEGAQN